MRQPLHFLWLGWTVLPVVGGVVLVHVGVLSVVHGAILRPVPGRSGMPFLAVVCLVLYLPPLAITLRWLRH